MVSHVGINPLNGFCSIYNEENKKTETFIVCKIEPNDIEKVEEMFKKINAKINGGGIGCTCIFLPSMYTNNSRKKFIESGKHHGLSKIQFVDGNGSIYLNYCFQTEYKSNIGDIICILNENNFCLLWEKTNTKAKILDAFSINPISTEDDLLEVKKKMSRNPNIIIIDKLLKDNLNQDFVKKIFQNCKLLISEAKNSRSEVALIKARIMAKDVEVMENDIFNQLQRKLIVKINDKEYMIFNGIEFLPIEKTVIIPIHNYEKLLKIVVLRLVDNDAIEFFSEEKKVTFEMFIAGEISFTFKIDENHISTTEFEIKEGKEIDRLKKLYSNDNEQVYNIPKKNLISNINLNVVGIDLGTSRCCAAVSGRNGIKIVAIDNAGEQLLPSYVGFEETQFKCGREVVRRLQNYSKSIVFDAKRIIGKNYTEVKIDESWPFEVIEMDKKPIIRVQGPNGEIEKFPEEVSAVLLKYIKQKCEELQGKELNEVVITVPAAFTENQKLATYAAGIFAGFKTIHLLAEPIAASIAYFADKSIPTDFVTLLFDLGGGTLDICIFKVANNNLQIITNHGDGYLGGRDFDQLLFDHFTKIFKDRFKIDVKEKDTLKYRLMQECINIKHTLSTEPKSGLDVADFTHDFNEYLEISRIDFEAMAKPLLNRIQALLIETMANANYVSKDISKILLVGGGCRMPMIRELLLNMFSSSEYSCNENPDEIVAIGAAYYASYINSQNNSYCSVM